MANDTTASPVASGGVPATNPLFIGNKTFGRIKSLQCTRVEVEVAPPPPARHELKEWDGVVRGSPAEEYEKQARGGLDAVRGDSLHYQTSQSVQDGLVGESFGVIMGKLLALGGKLGGKIVGAVKPAAKTVPEPPPVKPTELPTKTTQTKPASPGNGLYVEKPKTNHQKAAFGEKTAHDKMLEKGHESVGKTDGIYEPGKTGIDGVYKNPSPPPDYIISEVKYGSAQLEKGLADGTNQMDNRWVKDRLVDKVGDVEALKIQNAIDNGSVEKWLIRVGEDGTSTATKINAAGSPIRGAAGKVPGF